MPEWNLVEAQETRRAHASSIFALSKLIGVCYLGFAVLVLTMQAGCSKIRGGGLERNILRSNNTVPNLEARPIATKAQFNNDPSEALRELNEANGDFESSSSDEVGSKSETYEQEFGGVSGARIVEGSQQSFETQERGVKLVATQPPAPSLKNSFEAPAPSIKNSFEAAVSQPSFNVDRVLLGGVPLSEINSINPAKVIAQSDEKEKLKTVLPLSRPVKPVAFPEYVPPSELVSQPLAPILFDETTREVQAHDEQLVKQNQLRVLEQNVIETPIDFKEKVESQLVLEPSNFSNTQSSRQVPFYPTVDPNLGRTDKSISTCLNCQSYRCQGDCQANSRRPNDNQLRPFVASQQILPTTTAVPQAHVWPKAPKAPIEIEGEFLPAPEVALVEKTDYSEFTTQDWTEIFGPPVLPTEPRVQVKNRRSDFQAAPEISPPFTERPLVQKSQNQFQALDQNDGQNDFIPFDFDTDQSKVELVVAEVTSEDADEPASWVPPAHMNFSPIPNSVRERSQPTPTPSVAAVALENAAKRGIAATFPIVDTHVEIPPPKPQVIVEVVDNTVPWSVKLVETIDNVRRQRDGESDPMVRNGIEVNLRLLEVLQRQMITVEENRNLMPNNEADYWQHQLDAIALMLPSTNDSVSDLDRHNTAHQTLEHLRKAVERLESMAALKVSAGKFCTEISGFGKYKPFASSVFESGQKTLVYCEVENYMSNAHVVNSESSYHTRLRGSYVIYDSQGRVVQQSEYPAVEDVARNRRRDFYMYFPIQIGDLAAGDYKLELLVEDLSSNKTAALKPGITFQVR